MNLFIWKVWNSVNNGQSMSNPNWNGNKTISEVTTGEKTDSQAPPQLNPWRWQVLTAERIQHNGHLSSLTDPRRQPSAAENGGTTLEKQMGDIYVLCPQRISPRTLYTGQGRSYANASGSRHSSSTRKTINQPDYALLFSRGMSGLCLFQFPM